MEGRLPRRGQSLPHALLEVVFGLSFGLAVQRLAGDCHGTISSPGHPDCSIECPGSGYAVFVDPFGPCMAGCDQDRFSTAMIELFQDQDRISTVSGRVVGVKGEVLARMALDLRDLAPDDAADDLAWLERLVIQRGDTRFNAEWHEQSLSEVIETLAEATGREVPRGRLLRSRN